MVDLMEVVIKHSISITYLTVKKSLNLTATLIFFLKAVNYTLMV